MYGYQRRQHRQQRQLRHLHHRHPSHSLRGLEPPPPPTCSTPSRAWRRCFPSHPATRAWCGRGTRRQCPACPRRGRFARTRAMPSGRAKHRGLPRETYRQRNPRRDRRAAGGSWIRRGTSRCELLGSGRRGLGWRDGYGGRRVAWAGLASFFVSSVLQFGPVFFNKCHNVTTRQPELRLSSRLDQKIANGTGVPWRAQKIL